MEISYKRTHKESYMIISTEEYVSDYEEQMLKENRSGRSCLFIPWK